MSDDLDVDPARVRKFSRIACSWESGSDGPDALERLEAALRGLFVSPDQLADAIPRALSRCLGGPGSTRAVVSAPVESAVAAEAGAGSAGGRARRCRRRRRWRRGGDAGGGRWWAAGVVAGGSLAGLRCAGACGRRSSGGSPRCGNGRGLVEPGRGVRDLLRLLEPLAFAFGRQACGKRLRAWARAIARLACGRLRAGHPRRLVCRPHAGHPSIAAARGCRRT